MSPPKDPVAQAIWDYLLDHGWATIPELNAIFGHRWLAGRAFRQSMKDRSRKWMDVAPTMTDAYVQEAVTSGRYRLTSSVVREWHRQGLVERRDDPDGPRIGNRRTGVSYRVHRCQDCGEPHRMGGIRASGWERGELSRAKAQGGDGDTGRRLAPETGDHDSLPPGVQSGQAGQSRLGSCGNPGGNRYQGRLGTSPATT